MPKPPGQHLAAHVQAMISAAAQPKLAGRSAVWPPAAHVQAALGRSRPRGRCSPQGPPALAPAGQARPAGGRALASHLAAAIAGGAGSVGLPSQLPRGGAGALQRSALKTSEMAEIINTSYSGESESRNTQAVALYGDKKGILFTQREYSSFDSAIVGVEEKFGIKIEDRVIGDSRKEDEGIHAEMLAVSWWLQGHTKKPTFLSVSQGVCARCEAVLKLLKIPYEPSGGHYTANWVHPYRHAGQTPTGKLAELPQKVTKSKEYGWD